MDLKIGPYLVYAFVAIHNDAERHGVIEAFSEEEAISFLHKEFRGYTYLSLYETKRVYRVSGQAFPKLRLVN